MNDFPDILNWRRLSGTISLSGQPTEAQLSQIAGAGITHIVNLGPHSNKGALVDEAGTVASLGMTYIYLPVDFENPTDQNFTDFCQVLESLQEQTIHLHCIYNARVTAFVFRYAQTRKRIPEDRAADLMDSVWRPGGVWADFIGRSGDVDQPNRYAGADY